MGKITIPQELIPLPSVRRVYKAASSSSAGTFYFVFVFEDGSVDCQCPGWRNQKKCWHTTQAMEDEGGIEEFSVSL